MDSVRTDTVKRRDLTQVQYEKFMRLYFDSQLSVPMADIEKFDSWCKHNVGSKLYKKIVGDGDNLRFSYYVRLDDTHWMKLLLSI